MLEYLIMKSEREQILELIDTKPRHYAKMILNKTDLWNWVKSNTQAPQSSTAGQIYSAVYQVNEQCSHGQLRKFRSASDGFGGCGPAAVCACVAKQVSVGVKTTKATISAEEQAITNDRRRATNLERYGVTCSAQSTEIRSRHQEFYNDPDKVEEVLFKIRTTYNQRYGVDHCRQLPEVEQRRLATLMARYGVTNVAQIPSTKAKLQARTAEYKLTGHLLQKGYEKFRNYIDEKYNFELLTTYQDYPGIQQRDVQPMQFRCRTCGTEIVKKFYHGRGLSCPTCVPVTAKFVSNEEQSIFDFITKYLGVTGHQGDKKLINPYELDMVFPEHGIAVEYCGLYWHSEASSGKTQKYHYNKMLATNRAGYRLITIFSDEWNLKQSIVKSKLTNIFGCTKEKYHARKLQVVEVSSRESREFQDQHHLQGSSVAKINLGLHNQHNELVALMTFSHGRRALNTQSVEGEYELVRFVTNGSSVVGGASRLLKSFIRLYQPKKIISYADLRWSEGHVYETIGFEKKTQPSIGYWYVDGYATREHRYNFTKRRLVEAGADDTSTEWEIMQNLGYDRIWDCGHQKYTMILPLVSE